MRRAARRDETEHEIVYALRQTGALIRFMDQPCDLLVGFRGRWHLIEVKASEKIALADAKGMNKTQRTQRALREEAEFHGCVVHVVWTPEMALQAIGAMK